MLYIQVSLFDYGNVQFPSVSFCKRITFDNIPAVISQIKKINISEVAAKSWFFEHTWDRKRVTHFLSHSIIGKRKPFPCLTIGGEKPGIPCAFPFVFKSSNGTREEQLVCTDVDDVKQWCATRTTENDTYISLNWGYCSDDCQGEVPTSDSKFNLALDEFSDIWEEDIYRRVWRWLMPHL